VSTTKPNGATSYKETSFGIISRSKLLRLEIEGTKKGLDKVFNSQQVAITPQFIKKLHGTSFGWIFPEWAGKFRTIQVEFSGKEPPNYYLVPVLIVNLCDDLKERSKNLKTNSENYIEDVIELLAWFQHRFVWIHPFQDYNGRLARMLTILILLKLRLPPIEIKVQDNSSRRKYISAMQEADGGNLDTLKTLIKVALNESLLKFNRINEG